MNKLAVLAFSLLIFFSTMLWYLANGSLNDYLKSQVLLQSEYYSGQTSQLLNANFSAEKGITEFSRFSLSNIEGLSQPIVFTIANITAQLAVIPKRQLNSPSIQNKNTTVVHLKKLTLNNLQVWSEVTQTGSTNIEKLIQSINIQLATDYPALYPQLSAKMYAKKYPERSEALALEKLDGKSKNVVIESNTAVIASTKAKQEKRLLGKAQTRIFASSVVINNLTLTSISGTNQTSKHVEEITLGNLGGEHGLDSNQFGGELLRRLFDKINNIDKSPMAPE